MRTQCVTVTVRSAHSKAISSTSERDSLPVSNAVQSQSRQLKNEGENFFPRFAWSDGQYMPLGTAFGSDKS